VNAKTSLLLKTTLPRAAFSTFLFLALTYALFLASGAGGWINPILLTLILLVWLIFNRAKTGLELPVALFVGTLWLTGLTGIDSHRSLDQAWSITAGFLLIFLIAAATRILPAQRIVVILLGLGGLYMTWGWWDAAQWYQRWLHAAPGQWLTEIPFRLNGSNNIAAYLNLLLFAGLGLWLNARHWPEKVLQGIYILSSASLLFLTSSRGGWVGTVCGTGALIALILLDRGIDLRRTITHWIRDGRFWLGVGLGLAILAATAWYFLVGVANHPTHGAALSSRDGYWPIGWQAFLSSPWIGNGINTYVSFHMQWFSYPPGGIYLHSHNQYIDVLYGSGLLGAAVFLGLMIALGHSLFGIWRATSPGQRSLLIGTLAGLAAYLTHGVFDGLYRMPFASLTLAALLGVVLGTRGAESSHLPGEVNLSDAKNPSLPPLTTPLREREARGGKSRRILTPFGKGGQGGILCIALLCAAYGLFNAWRTEPYLSGIESTQPTALEQNLAQLAEAARRDPNFAPIYAQTGLFHSILAADGQTDHLVAASAAFEQAVRLDPSWGLNAANLGALYMAQGRLDLAEASLSRAVQAAPNAVPFIFNLGWVQEKLDKNIEASASYQKVIDLAPELRDAAFWQSSAVRQAALAKAQPAPPVPTRAELEALVTDGVAKANTYLALADDYRQQGQTARAAAAIEKAQLAYFTPRDGPEALWQQAELAYAAGDLENAQKLGEHALQLMSHPGIYGPGTSGERDYLSLAYGVGGSDQDFVPQMTPLPWPNAWTLRKARLEGWK
jgi:tetratricopeptide (TPR) repeat protein/O-antigen ligase